MSGRQAASSTPRHDEVSRVPVGLDADTVVAAALALIDEHGVPAFTIRALGERLGVRGPTIYWHVGSKAQLLEAVVERVITDMTAVVPAHGTWDERLRIFLTVARERLLGHPHVMELMHSVHSRAFERWAAQALDIMTDAGFGHGDAASRGRAALFHVLGAAHTEATARTAQYMEPTPDGDDEPTAGTKSGTKSGTRYRVRPDLLRENLDPRVALMTSYDLDEQHDIMTDIFVAGIRADPRRTRPG